VNRTPSKRTVAGATISATIADAAERYRARGWSVLPLRSRDKRPVIQWELLQKARPSVGEISQWFRRWPNANVGIVTGEISNLIVLDIDPQNGGNDALDRFEHRFGPLPATIESVTGGGGRHLYFAHPGRMIRNRAGIAPGVDLRGDGGYVVAPPSIHPSGRPYTWVAGHSPDEMTLAPLPHWILSSAGLSSRSGRSLADWRHLIHEGVSEGQRNSTIASLTGHLLWHGIDPDIALELLLTWNRVRCHPPLDDTEVAHAVASIVRLHSDKASAVDCR
jgi:hypothetical protein